MTWMGTGRWLVLPVATVLATSSFAVAGPTLEIGGMTGLHVFSDDNELGVPELVMGPAQETAVPIGVRVGGFWADFVGIEGELGVIPTEASDGGFSVWDLTYRAHLVAQLPMKVTPFVVAGGGAFQVIGSDAPDTIAEDTDGVIYTGAGAKYRFAERWGVRGDARVLFPPSSEDDGLTTDFEILASVYLELGRRGAVVEAEPEPEPEPVVEKDSDGDGLLDGVDRCPTDPEDKDEFEDSDGCPDPDNDGDRIADGDDGCPLDAEDMDAFEDDNGCPDPDNDADGIADASDGCPLEPETVNGFEDDNGCPDVLPVALKQFSGTIEGITFKDGSAEIERSSRPALEKAIAVLIQYPDTRIEIQGHTDDKPLLRGSAFADNTALSQARAEAVKEYFVEAGIAADRLTAKGYGDTQPVVDPTTSPDGKPLKRREKKAARAKNRRVEFHIITDAPPPPP